jgi:GntR family transcriptional repressor for pyruvate dehydrogenase complex
MLKAIKRKRLYEEIVQQIQELVREGQLKPGDRLPTERELAERLRVSRSSVREAIRALELQGLVVSRPGAGTFISAESLEALVYALASTLSEEKNALADIFEMRRILESQVASLAAERATEEDLRRMHQALSEQERQIERGETGAEADNAFHFAIAHAAQNWALVRLMHAIEEMLRQSRDQALQTPGRPQRSLASHRRILEAIERRDREAAREAMERHIREIEPGFNTQPPGG